MALAKVKAIAEGLIQAGINRVEARK